MFSEVAWMVLASLALLLEEVSAIPFRPGHPPWELRVYACGRIFLENKPIWAHGGLRHRIPPCITKRNANGSDRDGQRPLVCTQGMFDMAIEERTIDLLFTRTVGRI
jgi:hypothetical protein